MGKSSRGKNRTSDQHSANPATHLADADVPVVGPREPCPCGSGRRYKACHGRAAARAETQLVARPFEGLPSECDLVALAVLVPAATTTLTLKDAKAAPVLAATLLPMAWPALHRADDQVMVGLQVTGGSGDPSRDIAAALLEAVELPPGTPVLGVGRPGPGPRLQDVLDPSAPIEVVVHAGFDYWLDGALTDADDDVKAALGRANEEVVPTARLASVDAAYWCRIGTKEHLRWVLPEAEDDLLNAFARLAATDQLGLGPGTKYIGCFRSHGLLAAVWDLAPGDEADDVEAAASEFRERLDIVLADSSPLSPEARRHRTGIVSRQVTIR